MTKDIKLNKKKIKNLRLESAFGKMKKFKIKARGTKLASEKLVNAVLV